MKQEGKLGRNYLKGKIGDALQALLSCDGAYLRLILKYLRRFFASSLAQVGDEVVNKSINYYFRFD
jgi:IS5 family transposase